MICQLVGRSVRLSQKCKCPIFQQSIANYSLFYLEDDEKEEEEEEKEKEEEEEEKEEEKEEVEEEEEGRIQFPNKWLGNKCRLPNESSGGPEIQSHSS